MKISVFILLLLLGLGSALDYDWAATAVSNPLCVPAKGELGHRVNLYGSPDELLGGFIRPFAVVDTYFISWQPMIGLEVAPINILSLKARAGRDFRLIDSMFTDRPGVDMGGAYYRYAGRAGLTLPLMPILLDGAVHYQMLDTGRNTKLYDEFTDLVLAGPKPEEWGWEGKLVYNVVDNWLVGGIGQGWKDLQEGKERTQMMGGCIFYSFGKIPSANGLAGLIVGSYENAVKGPGLSIAATVEFWGPWGCGKKKMEK